MSDTIKIIVEIPKDDFKKLVNPYQHNEIWCERLKRIVLHGIPLNDVKAEIEASMYCDKDTRLVKNANASGLEKAIEILDNIGKAESEDVVVANKNLCDSCTTKNCIFQSGIVRNHCNFYKAESEEA